MKKIILSSISAFALTVSCQHNSPEPEPATESTTNNTTTVTTPKSFTNITFDKDNMFFSTSGSTNVTLDSTHAKSVASTIDITYTWDSGYDVPGFLDAITRSSHDYYWNGGFLQTNWTNVSRQTIWYNTIYYSWSSTVFEDAKADQSKIGQLFADTTKVIKTYGHGVWPNGTWFGGRNAVNSAALSQYKILAFKRVSDGKRGLIKVLSVPQIAINTTTKIDLIIEN